MNPTDSPSPLSRSKSISKVFRRAKTWLENESSTPLSDSQHSNAFQPPTRLTRSSTLYIKSSSTRDPDQSMRTRNQLPSFSHADSHLLLSENLRDVIPITGHIKSVQNFQKENLDINYEGEIRNLGDLSNLRRSFDGLYDQVEIGKRRSFVFISHDDSQAIPMETSTGRVGKNQHKIKRKPVNVGEQKIGAASQTTPSPQQITRPVKRIPRKPVPSYEEEIQPITILSPSDFNTDSTKTPELKPSSRSSISSIDSFSSSPSFSNEGNDFRSSQTHTCPSSPSPNRPKRSPSRSMKNKTSNPRITIETSEGFTSTCGTTTNRSRLSPVEPSPMEEIESPEFEFGGVVRKESARKRQGRIYLAQ